MTKFFIFKFNNQGFFRKHLNSFALKTLHLTLSSFIKNYLKAFIAEHKHLKEHIGQNTITKDIHIL